MKLLYNLNEAASELGVSRKTLEREMKAGRFPRPLKIATNSLVSRRDLEGYVAMLEGVREKLGGAPDWMQELKPAQAQSSAKPYYVGAHVPPPTPLVRTFKSNDPNRLP